MSWIVSMRPPEPPGDQEDDEESHEGIIQRVIHVPTRKVGYLIGHSGRTIFGFERRTGAKIDILAPNSKNPETPVSLHGTPDAIRHVIRMIMDLYGSNNLSSQLWKNNSQLQKPNPTGLEILATEEILVYPPLVNAIINNHGEKLKDIESNSGAKFVILHDQEDIQMTPVNITGTAGQIDDALVMFHDLKSQIQAELEDTWTPGLPTDSANTPDIAHPTYFPRRGRGGKSYFQPRKKLWTVDDIGMTKSVANGWSKKPQHLGFQSTRSYNGNHGCPPPPPGDSDFSSFYDPSQDMSQSRFTKESIFAQEHELNLLDVAEFCRRNRITAEWVPKMEGVELKELILSGLEIDVLNAKLDMLKAIQDLRRTADNFRTENDRNNNVDIEDNDEKLGHDFYSPSDD